MSALPLLSALRTYKPAYLRADLLAGLSVCIVMIPSVLAYAELLGVNPVHGLYAALAGMIAYSLLASSRQVVAGPDAAIALLAAAAIGPLAGGDAVRAATLGAVVALICGGLMLIASRMRVGAIADFLSKPVLVGYMSGAALILVSTQFGKLFGIKLTHTEFFPLLYELSTRLSETHALTLAIGIGLIVVLAVFRRIAPWIPGALIVCLLALGASILFNLESRGVKVIGLVDRGLPMPRLPIVSLNDIRDLVPAAIGIALLTFPEGVLLARAFAAKNRYDINPNQELAALAVANLAAGVFQGFPVGASQSRTTVNDAAGGKTQVATLAAAVGLGLFMLFLTPVLARLPVVALASILIFSGAHLIDIAGYAVLRRLTTHGFYLAIVVALGVTIVGVVPGILIGVMITLVYLLGQLARPQDVVLTELDHTGRFHDQDVAEGSTIPGLIAYRFYAPLFFANAEHIAARIRELIARSEPRARWFVLDAQAVWDIDVTAADAISRLKEELAAQNIELKIARANRPLREKLERIGLTDQLGQQNFYPSVHAAVEAFQKS